MGQGEGWKSTLGKLLLGIVVGAVLTPYVFQWYVGMLPGPKVTATAGGLKPKGGLAGCLFYTIELKTDEPLEYLEAKIQFPSRITDHKVGRPVETVMSNGVWKSEILIGGTNAQGVPTIHGASVTNSIDVQSIVSEHMLTVRASKLPRNASIWGIVAMNAAPTNTTILSFFSEGSYEYRKLGQDVRKPLLVLDQGIKSKD